MLVKVSDAGDSATPHGHNHPRLIRYIHTCVVTRRLHVVMPSDLRSHDLLLPLLSLPSLAAALAMLGASVLLHALKDPSVDGGTSGVEWR